ncbi:argininosuccinate lyase [Bacillus pseudomycoides]|nr:argininosuccinate lyase [Bacillus pseudomycoides]PGA75579.1 argininosuccinate lyase [Bacillus pseudomycoides]PHE10259.1 argininosuccinate lyase [Bacillus pseudomycoides]PHE89840.1 argininosuccinate lyase [Bacillus pseudomycoides]
MKVVNLTGRIKIGPSEVLHQEVLEPQFIYELEYYLLYYVAIEKVLLTEYKRLELITNENKEMIMKILDKVTKESINPDPTANMSDIAFAIEKFVEQNLEGEVPAWHIDRSRNDFQSCAQIMFGREQLLQVIKEMRDLSNSVYKLAKKTVYLPMPGYTHYQAAQIITLGFYLTAVNEQILLVMEKLLGVYDEMNKCPLGAGAMAGGEFEWDRNRMAMLLGFSEPRNHALIAVASRDWTLQISSELSNFGVFLSRFVTDLIQWGSSEYKFIDLPDQLSGISSAMPQKKNFPIFERIRGKTAHLHAFYSDFVLGQRNTAYSNLVETSKEAGTHVITMFETFKSTIRLLKTTVDNLSFNEKRMLDVCTEEFFGGFSLANKLTLSSGIPYRRAQVIAGQYILKMMETGFRPEHIDIGVLKGIGLEHGLQIKLTSEQLKSAFDVTHNIENKKTIGSTNPNDIKILMDEQEKRYKDIEKQWDKREEYIKKSVSQI